MRNSHFEDVAPLGRAFQVVNSFLFLRFDNPRLARLFTIDGLFWHVSGLLSDLDAAVEKRLRNA
jgi:hypothetical protein